MATFLGTPNIKLNVSLDLSESETRALSALTCYGTDEVMDVFLKTFYAELGKSYLQQHESGLRNFFNSCRKLLPGILSRIDSARKEFNK